MTNTANSGEYGSGRIRLRWFWWAFRARTTGWHDPVRCARGELRRQVLENDGYRCQRCDARDERLHIDHCMPWCAGGPTIPANLQALCSPCNLRKSDWPDDFRPRRWRTAAQVVGHDVVATVGGR